MELPDGIDERLWIKLESCPDRDYLVGNSHTFPCRMAAWCPTKKVGFSVSRAEITDMSEESALWVRGFLAGNEPAPENMFGPDFRDVDYADSRWARWEAAAAAFRKTGYWEPQPWRELPMLPTGTRFDHEPWTVIGDELWRWDGQGWAHPDAEPARHRTMLLDSLCSPA